MGVIAGLVAFGISFATRPHGAPPPTARASSTTLETRAAAFELHPGTGTLTVRARDGAIARDLELSVVVDGAAHPIVLARDDVRAAPDALRATVTVPVGDASFDAEITLALDPARDALAIDLGAPPGAATADHSVALRVELSSEGQVVFVPGVGEVADKATVDGGAFVLDVEPHPLAVVSSEGPLTLDASFEDPSQPESALRLSLTSPTHPGGDEHLGDLRVTVASSSQVVWRTLAELAGVPTGHVRGHVTGTAEHAHVFGRDAQGNPQLRALAGKDNAFDLEVPMSIVEWYAAIDAARTSGLASFVPSTPRDLVLDVSPGGDLRVAIIDAETRKPLTARLLVRGIDGTVDPSFGPDYRASGAGPVIDALRGEVATPLPSGRYRVAATKGIEWSVDAKEIEITAGRVTEVELAPRHVVPTPGTLSCDLHVHARPSFDTPVTPEDRVLSLVAAGIDFAVPTEHNIVGDYSSSVETMDLRGEFLTVPGVEVTTYNKGFGHFGVFPYPIGALVPPFKHTTMGAIFKSVRTDPSRFFQLNHPRLPKGIGYLSNIGFDPRAPRTHIHNRIDFDGIEVYNGYDEEKPERVEQVLRDYWTLLSFGWRYVATGSSDSHRIQFHWAGYPRTMVTVDPKATPDSDTRTVDPLVVVANIKKGHAVVTSGPMVELELGGARPGDEVVTTDDPVHGHLRVRAAPWIDVTRVDVVVGVVDAAADKGPAPAPRVVQSFAVPSRPTQLGPESGTPEEAAARTVRFDQDIDVAVGPANGWVQVVVRGERRMDDVLPFMPVPPFAFTNPVYVVRHPSPPPPFPNLRGPQLARP
jgi:hypothetical protein